MTQSKKANGGAEFWVAWIGGTALCWGIYMAAKWIVMECGFEKADEIVLGFIAAQVFIVAAAVGWIVGELRKINSN
jgi:uncharacterized membrane protein YcjF (UPF0283 family)